MAREVASVELDRLGSKKLCGPSAGLGAGIVEVGDASSVGKAEGSGVLGFLEVNEPVELVPDADCGIVGAVKKKFVRAGASDPELPKTVRGAFAAEFR